MRASIPSHLAGQSASVALCMYQVLEKACWTMACLCIGPETGLTQWVRIKKTTGKADFFFIGALLVSSGGLSSRLSSKCRLSR